MSGPTFPFPWSQDVYLDSPRTHKGLPRPVSPFNHDSIAAWTFEIRNAVAETDISECELQAISRLNLPESQTNAIRIVTVAKRAAKTPACCSGCLENKSSPLAFFVLKDDQLTIILDSSKLH